MRDGVMNMRATLVAVAASWAFSDAGCTVDRASLTCYTDFTQPPPGKPRVRVLGDPVFSGRITQEYCAQLCSDRKMPLAGVENADCMCGTKVLPPGAPKPSGCNKPINGNPKEKAGGRFEILVYSFTCHGAPVPKPPQPQPPRPAGPCGEFNQANCSALYNPCLDPSLPYQKLPFCDPLLPLDARAKDMVSRMTLEEKIGSLGNTAHSVAALGTHPYQWWNEASTGIDFRNVADVSPPVGNGTTKFPYPATSGMSFNRSLWKAIGNQIGREARALMNVGLGYSTFWAPVINLAREPRWGRNLETPGEDPYQVGQYAIHFTEGMQSSPDDPRYIQASACCKHYVLNSMESTTEPDGESENRGAVNSNVTQQDLLDSYMVPFQDCVEQGKVSGLMCSYNAINGEPACANEWLLKDTARGEWGFEGYITSDCDAVGDPASRTKFGDATHAAAAAIKAGTDNDCGGTYGRSLGPALNQSLISEADIDARLMNLWTVRLRLGHFDPEGPLDLLEPATTICTEGAIALSMQGTIQSAALLKNANRTLPLPVGAGAGTVAVIGPNANYSIKTGYYGPRLPCHGKQWTALDAVAKYASKVTYAAGVPNATSNDTSQIPAAVALAKDADTVVLVLGTSLAWAREGHDATQINFTAAQQQLVDQTLAVARKPVVVLLETAVPLDISELLASPKVGAILHLGQPSVTVLGAAELLFGKVSPSGRTVQTFYRAEYQDQISIFDFNMRPGPSTFARPDCFLPEPQCPRGSNPGRTHRFFTGKAVVPFGFGLSYTTFAYGLASAPADRVISLAPAQQLLDATVAAGRMFPASHLVNEAAPLAAYVVNVTNTGTMGADDVVLGFLIPPGAGVGGVPLQTLFGFERVHVKAGETVSVELYPSLTDFTQVGADGARRVLAGEYTVEFGTRQTATHGMGYVKHTIVTTL